MPCLGQVHTLSRTGSHEIVYPVQGREAKNHTLFSGTSPYRPYKAVTPRACWVLGALGIKFNSNEIK